MLTVELRDDTFRIHFYAYPKLHSDFMGIDPNGLKYPSLVDSVSCPEIGTYQRNMMALDAWDELVFGHHQHQEHCIS